jgi:hypothetical protein
MDPLPESVRDARETRRDAQVNEAARREMLRRDGKRDLGENLEQAAALIKAAYELRDSFSGAQG